MISGTETEQKRNISHAEKKKAFYNDKLKHHGRKSVKAVGWDDESKAIMRYALVGYEVSQLNAKSVLDYGCGLCHFRPFLKVNTQYHGYDTNENYVKAVRKESPNIHITDWLGEWPFDVVVAIGTFSYRANDESDGDFMEEVINNLLLIRNKIRPRHMIMSVLWEETCNIIDPKLFYFNGGHLKLIESETGARFVKLKAILYHENILIFEW